MNDSLRGLSAINVARYMERWARWRDNGCRSPVVSGEARIPSIIGKIMDGMKSTKCPACNGEGRMPGHKIGSDLPWIDPCPQCNGWGKVRGYIKTPSKRTIKCPDCMDDQGYSKGEIDGRTCIRCSGSGRRVIDYFKVNPASIPVTRRHGSNEQIDPISMMIDRTVASWRAHEHTMLFHIVAIIEYSVPGGQTSKAELARRYYRRLTNYRKEKKISQVCYSRSLSMVHRMIESKLASMLDISE